MNPGPCAVHQLTMTEGTREDWERRLGARNESSRGWAGRKEWKGGSRGLLTFAPVPLEVHVAPLAVIDLAAGRPQLDAPRAHVQQEIEVTIQQLHGKVVGPLGRTVAAYPGPSPPALAEEQQPIGLSGSEVQGDGTSALGAPAGQCDKGLRTLKGHRVQGSHILTTERQIPLQLHLRVPFLSQSG